MWYFIRLIEIPLMFMISWKLLYSGNFVPFWRIKIWLPKKNLALLIRSVFLIFNLFLSFDLQEVISDFYYKNVNGKILLVPKCTLKKMTLPSVWNRCQCKSLCVTQLLTICPITNRSLYINTKTKTFTYSTKTPPPIYVYPRSPLEN